MIGARIAAADAVARMRATLARERELYEVADTPDGAAWRRSSGVRPFRWDAPLPLEGIKRFFFPPSEPLLTWRGHEIRETTPDPTPFALFGVRACDLTALAYHDRFFARDPCYAARRRRALVVGVNCIAACAGGFCIDVDAGPVAREGFDLCLTQLDGGRVAVHVASPAGAELLERAGVVTRPLGTAGVSLLARARAAVRDSYVVRPFLGRAIARLRADEGPGAVPDEEWDRLAPVSLACDDCVSPCPTCSCYTIEDQVRGDAGERRRTWDSCVAEGFQREASGYDPTPRAADRIRRFWTHKFGRHYETTLGRAGCVGCGRCDVTCPETTGAMHVLAELGRER